MNKQKAALTNTFDKKDLYSLIIDSIQDIKGKNIISLDLRKLDDAPTDYFIICEGDSSTQMRAISSNVYKRLKLEAKLLPNHIEGENGDRWILVDYFDIVVHIFHPEARGFYELEELWSDAQITEFANL